MSTNPMQKKSRNSFLLGMLISLMVFLIIGALLYMFVIKKFMIPANETVTYVYKLKKDVESGGDITADMVEAVEVSSKVVPKGAFSSKTKDLETNKWRDKGFPSGYKSKIKLSTGTILGSDMVYEIEPTAKDLRLVEYNMITLPTTLDIGDYIDIRLSLSNGQDFIVISKAEIMSVQDSTIGLYLSEEEILIMNSAIVEAYIMTASNFYAVQYVEAGIQDASIYTYRPTNPVIDLINADTNIVNTAKSALKELYERDNIKAARNTLDGTVSQYSGEALTNIEAGIQEQIKAAKDARETYLKGLSGEV